jgi:iron complex outermembrane receptor protein
MIRLHQTGSFAALALAVAALPASLAHAQPAGAGDAQVEEIVVTAQKTGATKLQQTPIAISAFSKLDLQNSLTVNIKDLAQYAPNLNISQETANAEIYIRGIGSNNVFAGSDPDVTLQIDGVYMARPSEAFGDFLDVDRIEVLRGPQGTLYGRNAVGGTINIISKTPSDSFTGQEELTVGNYGEVQEQAYLSGPLIADKLQGSLAFSYMRHDGYLKNIAPGGNDIFDANHGGLRGQLRFEPTDDIIATTRFDWSMAYEHGNSWSTLLAPSPASPLANSTIGGYSEVALNSPQVTRTNSGGFSEDVDWTIDGDLSLKSITAYRTNTFHVLFDPDDSEVPYEISRQQEKERELTQEFDLNVHYTDFEGVAGLYYFHEGDDAYPTATLYHTPLIPSPPRTIMVQAFPITTADAEAAFVQGTYHILPTVALTVGYRYTVESKKLDQDYQEFFVGPPPVDIHPYPFVGTTTRYFHGITPKFGIDWNVADDAMLYFSATRGYKSGGLNYAAASVLAESFNPETIWSYEVGAKTDWLDHRLRVNLTGFMYDYNNLQVQSLLAPAVVAIGNAATASVKGVEAEIKARPTPDWQFTTNLTLLDATYDSFQKSSVAKTLIPFVSHLPQYDAATGTFDASGNRLDAAPRMTAFVSAQRDWDLANGDSIYARAEYSWQDRTYYDPTNIDVVSQAPYGLVNLFVGYDTSDQVWRAQLFAKNLMNKGYIISAVGEGVAPSGLTGAPRTYGVRVTANF